MKKESCFPYYSQFVYTELGIRREKSDLFFVTFQKESDLYPKEAVLKLFTGGKMSKGEREAEMLKKASESSPESIVSYYASFQHLGHFYLFMEHCNKGSLAEKIQRRNTVKMWSEKQLRSLIFTLAKAVQQIHAKGISHGDLKPENLLFNKEKRIKIGDFGEAMMEDDDGLMIRGSPGYQSPLLRAKVTNESAVRIVSNAFKDDIWALGRVISEIAACEIDIEMNDRLISTPENSSKSDFFRRLTDCYSPSLIHLVFDGMLNKDENERFSASYLVQELINLALVTTLPVPEPSDYPKCCICKRYILHSLSNDCLHIYCIPCLVHLLSLKSNFRAFPCCPECRESLSINLIQSVFPTLSEEAKNALEGLTSNQSVRYCPFCGSEFPVLKRRKTGKWKPYDLTCVCKRSFCSYCGVFGGHKLMIFIKRRCGVYKP